MNLDDLSAWINKFRHDRSFRNERGRRTVPIAKLCEFAGVNRPHLYCILNGKVPLTKNVSMRMAHAINAVEAGLRWERQEGRYVPNNKSKILKCYDKQRAVP